MVWDFDTMRGILAVVLFVVAVGWLLFWWARSGEDSAGWAMTKIAVTALLITGCLVSLSRHGVLGLIDVMASSIVLICLWARTLAALFARPFTSLFDGGSTWIEPKPLYSIAQSKRKQGKYNEAMVETRRQLEGFPRDFEGTLLLAAIQAEDLNDLPGAEGTLNGFCGTRDCPARQFSAAMNHLADWQLKFGQDPDAARQSLGRIVDRFPASELALNASQRIAHLADGGEFRAMRERDPIALVHGETGVGLNPSKAPSPPADPAAVAVECTERLKREPMDFEAREKLAVIYATHYHRLDLAAGELEQLIQLPSQPARQVVHWLNLLADLYLEHGADLVAAQETLRRIIKRHPGSAAAASARRRLDHLRLGLKRNESAAPVPLGTYEQDVGLKRRMENP